MNQNAAPIMIGPGAYATWRARPLGAITEATEQRLILALMGELRGARVLDAGCGDGALVCAIASRGAVATGADPDPAMIAAANARAKEEGIEATFVEARIDALPFADAEFDIVVAVTVLCFVADAKGAVHEMARVLRPGGVLVLGELGRRSAWAASRRLRGWLGSRTWAAARFHTAEELRALAQGARLHVVAVRGAVFYPPFALLARTLAPFEPRLGSVTTFGAGFIALSAIKAGTYDRA